jgi:hypothetical protein
VAGRWFSPGIPVSGTNKTDRHDITEILLKEELASIALTLTLTPTNYCCIILSSLTADLSFLYPLNKIKYNKGVNKQ